MQPSPYTTREYVKTLAHLGEVLTLEGGASLLVRQVQGIDCLDWAGPYPFLDGGHLAGLECDLRHATSQSVAALSAVLEPLTMPNERLISNVFPDFDRPFKQHALVDLGADLEAQRSSQHRRKVRRALRKVNVERASVDDSVREEWLGLYSGLREARGFAGQMADFDEAGLEAQLGLPGSRYYRARMSGTTVAAALWFDSEEFTWYHLGASTDAGRAVEASYALFDLALRQSVEAGLSWANLGGGAGLAEIEDDGLARFKRGWTPHLGWSRLVGRIISLATYESACQLGGPSRGGTFPPYRFPL